MPRKRAISGPAGGGWVEEVRTAEGVRFVAYWQKYVPDSSDPLGRRKVYGGSHDLGPKVKRGTGLTSITAARSRWSDIRALIMQQAVSEAPPEMQEKTFKWYSENVWIPSRRERWCETTLLVNSDYYFRTKLYPRFGECKLTEITNVEMQRFLNELRDHPYSRTVIDHCRIYLQAIFLHAHEKGLLPEDPAADLQMPKGITRAYRPYLPLDEYKRTLETLPTRRDQLMAKVLYMGALRRGELFALKWKDYDGKALLVDSQINRLGKEAPVKTEASEGYVSLPEDVRTELEEWKRWAGRVGPDDWIFTSRCRTPINANNWLNRTLKPAATAAGVAHINYHMFRRGLATELHQRHVVDKNIQNQLRHADPNITRKLYMREVPEAQAAVVEAFSQEAIKEEKNEK
jgi:integrase